MKKVKIIEITNFESGICSITVKLHFLSQVGKIGLNVNIFTTSINEETQ